MILPIKNILFRLRRLAGRTLIKWSGRPRPTSNPYLSSDGFRALADHLFDETGNFDPAHVAAGQIIYVKTDRLDEFFAEVHPRIRFPYKLITGGSDRNITPADFKKVDGKIIRWFAQNVTFQADRLVPLPIGLENLSYYSNGIPALFDRQRKKHSRKQARILYGFSIATNRKVREPLNERLNRLATTDHISGFPPPPVYLKLLDRYQFVASPPGGGLDCHRTWEALYLGVVPIVESSSSTIYFKQLGLPLWLVDNWAELDNNSETDLAARYQQLMAEADTAALWLPYWEKLIRG